MVKKGIAPPPSAFSERDLRARMGRVRVLVADNDHRLALLIQRVLFSFGFRGIELVTNGEEALQKIEAHPFDLLITEWNMAPIDGIALVKAIRGAKNMNRLKRDVPILMLTASSEKDNVQAARDAGINEFVAKPFSAKTISNRIVRIIDYPRAFIDTPAFAGPCRRRKGEPPPGVADRRLPRGGAKQPAIPAIITPPDFSLRDKLGVSAADIITDAVVLEAQVELMKAEAEFIDWAKNDVARLNDAYQQLLADPFNVSSQHALRDATYAIKSLAGTFGYDLGTVIAGMLLNYIESKHHPSEGWLTVIRKHIDAVSVIFSQKIKDSGQHIGVALVESLTLLIRKLS